MKTQKLTGVLLVCWISRWTTVRAATSRRYSQPSQTSTPTSFVERDSQLTTPQLIAAYGYPVETHRVRTQDGYLLTLHRIPPRPSASARARARSPGRRAQRAPGQGRAVLLQHGVLCSSADWVVMGPGKALAYLLSDAGYDVWLGNARGNRYSKGHEKALPKQRYWSFSFHEMGVYDLPAVIDFILQKTGHRQLHYVGHSMGTTMFYVMASERPEYNAKVRLMVGLAPIAFLSHMKTGFLRFLASIGDQLGWFLMRAGFDEFQPSDQMRELARSALCTENALSSELCVLLFVLGGFDSTQLNRTMLPVIAAHTPAGTSTKVFHHYAQVAKSGKFQQMDLGAKENSARYGRALPPQYSLGRVTAPVALYTGDNDNLCGPEDVAKLHLGLNNVIGHYRVPYSKFNHLDFLWANDAKTFLYDDLIRLLDKW